MKTLKHLLRLPIWTLPAYFSLLFITPSKGATSAKAGETWEYSIDCARATFTYTLPVKPTPSVSTSGTTCNAGYDSYSLVPVPDATIEISGCSNMAVVTVTNSPPANVTWYWQEAEDSTSTAHPSTVAFNSTEAKTYYLRGLMDTTWSPAQAHAISPRPEVTTPEEPVVSDNTCGSATLTFSPASRGENTWYWQTAADSSSTAEGMDTKTITEAGTSTLYVRAKDSHNCWSTAVAKTVTVHPIPPIPTPASGGICTGETFTREAGTGDFSRARWYADAALANWLFTGQSFSAAPTASATSYYVRNFSEQGCFSDTTKFTITIHTKPVAPAAPSCNYDTRALTFNGEPATGIQWCWQTEETGTSTENSSSPYTAPANGVYYLRASNQGCWGDATPIVAWQKSGLQTSKDKDYVKVETILKSGVKTDAEVDTLSYTEKATGITYLGAGSQTLESLSLNESPEANDLVNTTHYDKWGRNERSYLPFADGSSNALYRSNADTLREAFYSHATDKIADDTKPYSRVEFENPVTNQVIKSYGAGSDFVDSKYIASNWEFNAANAVRRWTIANNLPSSTDFYPAADLVVKENRDEGSTASRTYTDWKGTIVMKEAQVSDTEWAQTYYLYDDYGNVLFVIPPMLAANLTPTQTEVNQWCYQYTYDNRQRKITSKQPGAEWVYTIYDQWDRPLLSQDGIQRLKSPAEWSFIKYDHWNRAVMTGTLASTATADSLRRGAMSAVDRYESRTNTSLGYTTTTYPTVTESEVLSVSYFDDYGFLSYTNWDTESNIYSFVSETGYETTCRGDSTKKVLDLPTGSKTRVIGMDKWLNAVTYYDDKMRPLQTISENFSGKTDRLTTLYDWPGKVLQTKLVHAYNTATTTIVERTSYDHRGRILHTYHKINDQDEVTLASFEYNELGQVTKKTLHGDLQAIDYRYNIRGQLTDYNFTARDEGQKDDFFGQNFEYNDDGTIKTIKWKDDLSGEEKKYDLAYLKRNYTAATFYKKEAATNAYNESNIAYDKNGNITTLHRNAADSTSSVLIDNLSYSYTGNQLQSVSDAATTAGFNDGNTNGNDYNYDVDGNLVEDKNKNIRITYNNLGLPQRITFSDSSYFLFTYSASGEKLREAYLKAPNDLVAVRDFAGEFVYYGPTSDSLILGLIFHDHGRVVPAANNTWEYQYYLTDHLGSVRSVLQTKPETTTITATFESDKYEEESTQFSNLKSENEVVHPSVPDKKVYKLNANTKVGPYRSFRVLPGDTIKARVRAYYGAGTWGAKEVAANVATAVANALTSGTESTNGVKSGYNATGTLFNLSPTQSNDKPAAFLNYILFDEQYVPLEAGSQPVGSPDVWGNIALPDIKIKKMGYLLVYLSYDNTSGPDVFFDNFTIEYKESNLIQTTAYYPYGMTAYTWMRDAEILNRYGFQGKEWEDKTQWYDFHARQYDPVLGRWFAMDPANQFASGYMGMGDNPIMGIDPDGRILTWSIGKNGLSIGFNLTPIGIPVGAGINVGWGDGFSMGVYAEAGYRVGGTGAGGGATASHSLDYNFKYNNWSTTSYQGAYASFGAFNAGAGASQTYDISNDRWSSGWGVNAGVGFGFNNGRGSIGLSIGYGSNGFTYGINGSYKTRAPSAEMETEPESNTDNTTASNEISPELMAYILQEGEVVSLYSNETAAYNDMWNNSFRDGKVYKENFAWLTKKGVLVLPTANNKSDKANPWALPTKQVNGRWYVLYKGSWLRIMSSIHTHPNGLEQGPSIGDFSFSNKMNRMSHYIIGTREVWGYSTIQRNPIGTHPELMNGRIVIIPNLSLFPHK